MKGIIYSAPMVLAILAGRKDVTRRPMNPQPHKFAVNWWDWKGYLQEEWANHAPYKLGEVVYVKEAWAILRLNPNQLADVFYKATGISEHRTVEWNQWLSQHWNKDKWEVWRSSMFMPEWASRIHLKILAVRAERLQEITEAEAIREGWFGDGLTDYGRAHWTPLGWYASLWDSMYRKYPWASNPWVFRYQIQTVSGIKESRQ